MHPPKRPEAAGSAELLLYDALAGLPDEYQVFHSVRWRRSEKAQPERPGSRLVERRGETDFVVLHPRYGLLLIEAKGGKLRRDGATGDWFSEDAAGVEHEMADPFVQVDDDLFALRDYLRDGVGTRRFRYEVQSGVALVHTVVEGAIAMHAPRHAVIDSSDLPDIEAAVVRLFRQPLERPLSKEALAAATDMLTPDFTLEKVGLNARFEEIARTRLDPTDSQRFLLNHFEHTPRAQVQGCAGSGKTLIALEKARRLARAGQEVLFLCYNRQLALWAAAAANDGSFPAGRVKCQHFHSLADEACAAAGISLFPNPGDPDWENVPQRLEAALAKVPMKFDAIVVDEAQDFQSEWWLVVIGELLRRPDEDALYVFFDPNQRIYGGSLDLPADLPLYPLDSNLRNTQQIHAEVLNYFQGDPLPKSEGPSGTEVVRLPGPVVKGVQGALDELVNKQKVPTAQIIVLTGRAQAKSDLTEGRKLGNVGLTWHPPRAGEVQVATVQGFKGLERPVVVLTELDHLLRDPARLQYAESLLYIGASRAMNHLVLVSDELPLAD